MPRLKVRITKAELARIDKERLREEVVTMMLESKTNQEIVDELNVRRPDEKMTLDRVKTIIVQPEFKLSLDKALAEMRKDPRRDVVIHAIRDMLPEAFRAVRDALTNMDAPFNAKRWAVDMVFKMNDILAGDEDEGTDIEKMKKFLREMNISAAGISLTQNNYFGDSVPENYLKLLEESQPVDAEVTVLSEDQ